MRLLVGIEEWPAERHNIARYVFLHPAAKSLFDDWANIIHGCVARLRTLAGTDPDTPGLTELVDELLAGSPEFTELWHRYEVEGRTWGTKKFHHPEFGTATLAYQALELAGSPGLRLVAYHAEPGGPEYEAMAKLDR